MQIGAKLALFTFTHHGRDDFVANDEAANISTARFLDKFLHHEVGFQTTKGLDYAFCGFVRFGKYHTDALSSFQQLNHNGCAAHQFQQVIGVTRRIRKSGYRQPQTLTGQ